MYAVLVNATIAGDQGDASLKMLREQTVPRIKQMPGVVRGYWMRSGNHGTSVVVFASKQNADEAAATVRGMAPPSVTINSVEVKEVVADV
jgi:hypothetical protein